MLDHVKLDILLLWWQSLALTFGSDEVTILLLGKEVSLRFFFWKERSLISLLGASGVPLLDAVWIGFVYDLRRRPLLRESERLSDWEVEIWVRVLATDLMLWGLALISFSDIVCLRRLVTVEVMKRGTNPELLLILTSLSDDFGVASVSLRWFIGERSFSSMSSSYFSWVVRKSFLFSVSRHSASCKRVMIFLQLSWVF